MSSTHLPEIKEKELVKELLEEELQNPWHCILFNDDIHTFDEVINQIILATGFEQIKAEQIAINVHNTGKDIVISGEFETCFKVSSILEEIFLRTEIQG